MGAGSLDESNLVSDISEDEESEDEDAAVIRFVNEVVQKAVSDRATDIHFEPTVTNYKCYQSTANSWLCESRII